MDKISKLENYFWTAMYLDCVTTMNDRDWIRIQDYEGCTAGTLTIEKYKQMILLLYTSNLSSKKERNTMIKEFCLEHQIR